MNFRLANGGSVQLDVADDGNHRPLILLTVTATVPNDIGRCVPLDEGNAEALEHALIAARLQVQTRAAGR